MDLNLQDRVVLVTGANRGIGRAIAEAAAAEGALIAVVGRDAEAGRDTVASLPEGRSSWFVCDVTDQAQIGRLIEAVVGRWSRLDAVVNNAGRSGGSPNPEPPGAARRGGSDPRAVVAMQFGQAALPHLRQSDQARVVNISGITAQRITPGVAVPAVANSGMIALTAYLARELIE